MKISNIWLVPLLSMATACGGSGSTTSNSDPSIPAAIQEAQGMPDEQHVIMLLYDNHYSVPDGFYVDERADTERRNQQTKGESDRHCPLHRFCLVFDETFLSRDEGWVISGGVTGYETLDGGLTFVRFLRPPNAHQNFYGPLDQERKEH